MSNQALIDLSDARNAMLKKLYPEAFVSTATIDIELLMESMGLALNDVAQDDECHEEEPLEESVWIIPWLQNRIAENRNANLIFVGDTGSGKSYSAISLGEQVDTNFSADRIVFTAKDFVALINSDLPKGSVVIFDDAGLGIPAREWQGIAAKIFGKLLQGFRYKNLISLITVPDMSFIERQSRTLMHLYLEASDVQGVMKPFRPFHPFRGDDRLGFKYPTMAVGGRETQVKTASFVLPSKDMREAYETKKGEYMEKTNKEFQLELEYAEVMQQKAQEEMRARIEKVLNMKKEKEEQIKKRRRVIELREAGYSIRDIASEVGMSIGWVQKVNTP